MQALSRSGPRRARALLLALGALLVVVALAFAARPAGAAPASAPLPAPAPTPAAKTCPGFRVVHNDRIGPAVFPAGTYTITLEDASLTCASSGALFARFLEVFDGVLPTPWKVSPGAPGKSFFTRGALPGFSVELTGKRGEEGGTSPVLGTLCPGTFTVHTTTVVGPLRFTKGKFLTYIPAGSGITCNRAAVLFTRFLGTGGPLPPPWKVINQTATFYRPAQPRGSSFRIEPLAGSGRR
jgi:hypothetical protein